MNHRVLVLLLLGILVAGPTATAFTLVEVRVSLSHGEWVAVRIANNGQGPVSIGGSVESCSAPSDQESGLKGEATFTIVDGRVTTYSFGQFRVWAVGSDVVSAGVQGNEVRPNAGSNEGLCGFSSVSADSFPSPPSESLTLVIVAASTWSWANLTLALPSPDTPFDTWTGQGLALTKQQFEGGVHANVHPSTGLASVGQATHTMSTPADAVGLFWPSTGTGVARPYCTIDARSCEPPNSRGISLLSDSGGAYWTMGTGVEAQIGEAPYHALLFADIGRDDLIE